MQARFKQLTQLSAISPLKFTAFTPSTLKVIPVRLKFGLVNSQKEQKMMKKAKALVLTTTLIGSVMLSTEASAATKITTGTPCTTKQKNKTTKVTIKGASETYRCTNNPIARGAAAKRLTWVTLDCINTNREIRETTAVIAGLKASGTASAADISMAETLNGTAKDLLSVVCGRGW
jgi:hypothetical protein